MEDYGTVEIIAFDELIERHVPLSEIACRAYPHKIRQDTEAAFGDGMNMIEVNVGTE